MKVVKHIDLYLSYTGKRIIDLNWCGSLAFDSPFIFSTRWLMHIEERIRNFLGPASLG